MRSVTRCLFMTGLILSIGFFAPSSFGGILYSENGGGQQFWITGDAFVDRSTDGGSPNFFADPDANDPLSGSAYYFGTALGEESPSSDQRDWWVQYDVPTSSLPAHFNLTGEWGFWVRTQTPTEESVGGGDKWHDADWLFVNGHATDLNVSNPTEADWGAALASRDNGDDRVLQSMAMFGDTGVRPNWRWHSHDENAPSPGVFKKTLAVIDDKVSFRLYEREASPYNGRVDVIVFANSDTYWPTDADFNGAVPEPATLLLAAFGGLALMRRKR